MPAAYEEDVKFFNDERGFGWLHHSERRGPRTPDIAGTDADLIGRFAESTVEAMVIAAEATPKGDVMS